MVASGGNLDVTVLHRAPAQAVERAWREIEDRSAHAFFLSSHWMSAWLKATAPDATLFLVSRRGVAVGAALIARAPRSVRNPLRRQYRLHEAGIAPADGLFIEYNGVLADPSIASDVFANIVSELKRRVAASWTGVFPNQLIISAAAPAFAAMAQARCAGVEILKRERSPYVDLARLRAAGRPFLEALSANARQQLRRARRDFEAIGPLRLERAGTVERALGFLSELKPLHVARWRARRKPSGFDNPVFEPMLRELVASGVPAGTVDVLRLSAGDKALGYLVNFRYRGAVSNYTSGFAYGDHPGLKPGLVSHLLAIEKAYTSGAESYKFLAGTSRYKASLSTDSEELAWLRLRL